MSQTPMKVTVPNCDGKCRAVVQAPGVAKIGCTSETWRITSEMMHNPNATWGPWKSTFVDGFGQVTATLPIFNVHLLQDSTQPTTEAAILTVGLASWTHFEGEYVETTCSLLPAIVEYDVVFVGGTIVLPRTPDQGRAIRMVKNTRPVDPTNFHVEQLDTMDGITGLVAILVAGNATAAINPQAGPQSFWTTNPFSYNAQVLRHIHTFDQYDTMSFIDPTSDVLFTFNSWLLHAASLAAVTWSEIERDLDPGVLVNQSVSATQKITHNVYRTDLRWYAAAATIQLLTVLLILPMFWGWWTLGCDLTMSPFSAALAFDAPLLKDVNSAAGATGVVQQLGGMKLKLGAVDTVSSVEGVEIDERPDLITSGRLGVGKSDEVKKLSKGMRFSK